MNFPQRLIDGYGAFASGRLQSEQHRYRELAERGQTPEIMVIGCCDSRVSPEVIFDARPGRTVRGAQRRQPGAAVRDRRHLSRRLGGAGVRRRRAQGQAHRRARPRPLRRRAGLCRGRRAALARRFHRPLDVADGAGRRKGRPARQHVARRISGAAGEGVGRQHARQPDDVPAAAQADRARRGDAARRLFRRGDRASFRCSTRRPASSGRSEPNQAKPRYPLPASPAHARARPAR